MHLAIATANMARTIRSFATARGIEPERLSLVAYGGAGPLLAVGVAAELDVGKAKLVGHDGSPVEDETPTDFTNAPRAIPASIGSGSLEQGGGPDIDPAPSAPTEGASEDEGDE